MSKPIACDLYCGGGGASEGLHRAGFRVIGIDIAKQPEYPFEYWVQDIITLDPKQLCNFDLIWASPPCQKYTWATKHTNKVYVDLIPKTKTLLKAAGVPYVIENVWTAPIRRDLWLCGDMFGLKIIRRRIFELEGFSALAPLLYSKGKGTVKNGSYHCVAGHQHKKGETVEVMGKAMGIDWIKSRPTLNQAVPPAYAEWIGRAFLKKYKEEHEITR